MGKFLTEFKEFAMKGNVVDMAVGIIIGGAFVSMNRVKRKVEEAPSAPSNEEVLRRFATCSNKT